jgi:hypothetical protein
VNIKKKYIKPKVIKIRLDNTISLVMMTWHPGDGKPPHPPHPPHPHGTFESPFGDKPFN